MPQLTPSCDPRVWEVVGSNTHGDAIVAIGAIGPEVSKSIDIEEESGAKMLQLSMMLKNKSETRREHKKEQKASDKITAKCKCATKLLKNMLKSSQISSKTDNKMYEKNAQKTGKMYKTHK